MNAKAVSFTVLMQEPMTKDESEQVKAGIAIDTWPAVKRWAKRSKLNDLSKVVYVEPLLNGPVTQESVMALAKCIGNCDRRFAKRK